MQRVAEQCYDCQCNFVNGIMVPPAATAMDKPDMQVHKHDSCSQCPLSSLSVPAPDCWLRRFALQHFSSGASRAALGQVCLCQVVSRQKALPMHSVSTAGPHHIPNPLSHLLSFSGLSTGSADCAAGASYMPAYVLSSTTYESACSKIHRQQPRWEQPRGGQGSLESCTCML
jgi:hypothetical protein